MVNQNIAKDFSIVIPVYNEAGVIKDVARGFYEKVVKKIVPRFSAIPEVLP